jgi:hypothetical protein
MSTATAARQPAADPKAFYDGLVRTLEVRRDALSETEKSFGGYQPLDQAELLEWLKFQCWYEQEAAGFIGSWLRDTPSTTN